MGNRPQRQVNSCSTQVAWQLLVSFSRLIRVGYFTAQCAEKNALSKENATEKTEIRIAITP
jgi:hypothetical protein